MTKSSRLIVNDSRKPATMPGMSSGRTTFMKALKGLAPKSCAASYVPAEAVLMRGMMDRMT